MKILTITWKFFELITKSEKYFILSIYKYIKKVTTRLSEALEALKEFFKVFKRKSRVTISFAEYRSDMDITLKLKTRGFAEAPREVESNLKIRILQVPAAGESET